MELAKYLVLIWQGHEQAVTFPGHIQHADVLRYIRHESPTVQAVSAGFFADDTAGFWHGGVSESLKLTSRSQDGDLLMRMLKSHDRRNWDLRVLVWEACEAARRNVPRVNTPHMFMSV